MLILMYLDSSEINSDRVTEVALTMLMDGTEGDRGNDNATADNLGMSDNLHRSEDKYSLAVCVNLYIHGKFLKLFETNWRLSKRGESCYGIMGF